MVIRLVKTLHVELSSVCTATCPLCPRNKIPGFKGQHLEWRAVENLLTPKAMECINTFLLCGNFGDPIYYPRLFDFIDLVNDKKILIWTNGSIHPGLWWRKLGAKLNNGTVNFCLDGLYSVHRLYRGTTFNTVYRNMQTFIDAGGNAVWQFIVFKHNEHLLKHAEDMANAVGAKFYARPSREYNNDLEEPVKFKTKLLKGGCKVDEPWELYVGSNGKVTICCYWFRRGLFKDEKTLNDTTIDKILMSKSFLKQLSQRKKMERCKKRCL